MRIRTLKPEFHSSFSIAKLSEPAVILAAGVLNLADDRGFFEADPRIIKASIFPLREPSRSIPGMLSELVGIDYVELRKATNGRLVGHVLNFERHQVINKKSKTFSKAHLDFDKGHEANEFTAIIETDPLQFSDHSGSPPVVLPEGSGKKPAGTGNREQGNGTGKSSCPESAAPLPDGQGEGDKTDDPQAGEPSAEGGKFVDWFLLLLSETGAPTPKLTPSNRAAWALCYDRLLRIDGYTKEQVKEVCRWARNDTFWRSNFLSPVKLREKKEGVSYFERFTAKMTSPTAFGGATAGGKKPASIWDLQQRETAIKDRMRDLSEGHKGQKYVGLMPGSTNPYVWTPEGKAEYDRLQTDLAAVKAQIAQRPGEDRDND